MIFGNDRTKGFTLIELMCSMVIASIILLLIAITLAASGDSYGRIKANVESEREGRTLVNQLVSDLANAQFHKHFMIQKSPNVWPTDHLGFLTLAPALAQSETGRVGDLCAVVYYIKDLTINGKTVRCVMRGFRESLETFKALENNDVSLIYQENLALDEPIALGIISFAARPKLRDTNGKWIDWAESTHTNPQAIDLRIVVARHTLARRLNTADDWNGVGAAGSLIGNATHAERNANLEVYSTMICLKSHEID